MPDKEKKTYRLYALAVNQDNVAEAQNHRFSRITPLYLLIYSENKLSESNSVEITEKDIERLTSADRDWLLGCNMALIVEDAKRREKEISISIGEKIERLEKALEEASKQSENREPIHAVD